MKDDLRQPSDDEQREKGLISEDLTAWVKNQAEQGRRPDLIAAALLWCAASQYAGARDEGGRYAVTLRAAKDLFEQYWNAIRAMMEKTS